MSEWKCRYAFGKECQVTECKYEVCDLPLVYQQGRADTIDEVKELMKEYATFENVDVFVGALNNLKEQTNGVE